MQARVLWAALAAASCAAVFAGDTSRTGTHDGVLAALSAHLGGFARHLGGFARQVREGAGVLVDSVTCIAAPAGSCSAQDAVSGKCSPIEGAGIWARCSESARRLLDSPSAMLLLLASAGFLITAGNVPAAVDWLQVQCETLAIQTRYLAQVCSE